MDEYDEMLSAVAVIAHAPLVSSFVLSFVRSVVSGICNNCFCDVFGVFMNLSNRDHHRRMALTQSRVVGGGT